MKLLLESEVFKKTLEVATYRVVSSGDFTDIVDWINTFEKLTGEVFFEKYEEFIDKYNDSSKNMLKNLLSNSEAPGVEDVFNHLFKGKNPTIINQVFSILLEKEETDNEKSLEKILNKFIVFDKKENFWSAEEKNSFVTANPIIQKVLARDFYKIGISEIEALKDHKEVFSFFGIIENIYMKNGAEAIPQNVWNLMPAVYDTFDHVISSNSLLNATYDNFRSKAGDKILYNFSRASIAIYGKEVSVEFQGETIKHEDNYFIKEILGILDMNDLEKLKSPEKASYFSIKSPKAAMDFLKKEFSEWDSSNEDALKERKNLIKNWINSYQPIIENSELILKPIEFLLEEISKKGIKDLNKNILTMEILAPNQNIDMPILNEFKSKLLKEYMPQILNDVSENILTNGGSKNLLNIGQVKYFQKYVTYVLKNIECPAECEESYVAAVLKSSLNKLLSTTFQDSFKDSDYVNNISELPANNLLNFLNKENQKAKEGDYVNNISKLPANNLLNFLNKENHKTEYDDIIFDTNGKILSILGNSLQVEHADKLFPIIFKVDSMLNDIKTMKFGNSSFFNKVLTSFDVSESFISELRNNLNNETVQSFLEIKTFRSAMSMTRARGAKETLLSMDLNKKINKVVEKNNPEQTELKINEFKL